jgi:hypothetical protein
MPRTFVWLTAALITLGAQVAGAQESPNVETTTRDPVTGSPAAQRAEQRIERRELRRSGELPAALGSGAAPGTGVDVAVPGTGVDVIGARGAGVGVTAPGVGVTVPPAGSGAGVGINVPSAGINATVNPNAWRYRFHNNRWWYYHPTNRWSFWNNNRWNAYRDTSTAAANDPSSRRFSNAPRYQSGYRGVPSAAENTGTAAGSGPANQTNVDKSPLERANPGDASVPAGP